MPCPPWPARWWAAPAAAAAASTQKQRSLRQFVAGGLAGAVSKTLVAPMERVSTLLMTDAQRRFSLGAAARHAWRDGLYRGHAATLVKVGLECRCRLEQPVAGVLPAACHAKEPPFPCPTVHPHCPRGCCLQIFPASAIQFAVFNTIKDRILAGKQRLAAAAATAQASSSSSSSSSEASVSSSAAAPVADLANHERLFAGAAAGAAAASMCYPLEALRTQMGGELLVGMEKDGRCLLWCQLGGLLAALQAEHLKA